MIIDEMIEAGARAASKYASSLPKSSMDAPFIRAHRFELARAVLEAALPSVVEEIASVAENKFCELGHVAAGEEFTEITAAIRSLGAKTITYAPGLPGTAQLPDRTLSLS